MISTDAGSAAGRAEESFEGRAWWPLLIRLYSTTGSAKFPDVVDDTYLRQPCWFRILFAQEPNNILTDRQPCSTGTA